MLSFAEEVGVHVITLRRLMNAEDSVQRDLFEKIETATGRQLRAVELYALYLRQRDGDAPKAATDLRASA